MNCGDTDKWSKKPIWITFYWKKLDITFSICQVVEVPREL